MPIYEYRCGACGHAFDALEKMSASADKECPACQGPASRQISTPSPTRKVRDACVGGRPMGDCGAMGGGGG
jgi:putative FmdB family regulatory protein